MYNYWTDFIIELQDEGLCHRNPSDPGILYFLKYHFYNYVDHDDLVESESLLKNDVPFHLFSRGLLLAFNFYVEEEKVNREKLGRSNKKLALLYDLLHKFRLSFQHGYKLQISKKTSKLEKLYLRGLTTKFNLEASDKRLQINFEKIHKRINIFPAYAGSNIESTSQDAEAMTNSIYGEIDEIHPSKSQKILEDVESKGICLSPSIQYELLRILALNYLDYSSLIEHTDLAIKSLSDSINMQFLVSTPLLIFAYANRDIDSLHKLYSKFSCVLDKHRGSATLLGTLEIFWSMILKLLIILQKIGLPKSHYDETIYTLGESHSLVPAHRVISDEANKYTFSPRFLMGIKMYHFQPGIKNYQTLAFSQALKSIPLDAKILITIGEIDCRLDEGIILYARKKGLVVNEVLTDTIDGFLESLLQERNSNFIIQGIPTLNLNRYTDRTFEEKTLLAQLIEKANSYLKFRCKKIGFRFFDIAEAMKELGKSGNDSAHIDSIHVSPDVYNNFTKYTM